MIKQKYILLILNCYKYKNKAMKQKEGWLKNLNNMIVYFHVIGDSNKCGNNDYYFDFSNNVLYTNTKDCYLSLPHKVITALKAVNETFEYDYVFKTDDDQTLVNNKFFDVLIGLIKNNKYDYGGCMIKVNDHYSKYYTVHNELPKNLFLKGTSYCNGRFYMLSNKAVLNLLPKFDMISQHIIEDHAIGLYLDENIIQSFLPIDNNKYFIDT